ncbi:M23 family metallopeptidase [Candidatus Uhrbacteria bacterium]|nr:M23 family metallopeptidase [Candidatus Uhrbacteria bacterium]
MFKPIMTAGYRLYLSIKRSLADALGTAEDGLHRVFLNKYIVHVAVVALSFLVSATNLYARDDSSAHEAGRRSILGGLENFDGEEEVLIEEVVDQSGGTEFTYVGNQALGANDVLDEIDENTIDDEYLSPIANAVRPTPDAASVEARPTRTQITEYVVQPGDVIGSIAERFGLRVATVLQTNGLGARSLIRPGDKLTILPVDGVRHKVKKGDTVAALAKLYKAEAGKILEMNSLVDSSPLAVGVEIIVPDGRLPPPPPPKPTPRLATDLRNIFVPPTAVAGKMLWPTAVRRITQYYGRRHTGVDIAGPVGTPLYAADDGIVEFSGWNRGGYGNMTIVNHQNGLYTRYAHATKNLTKVGAVVKKGDIIALMGSTGRSTGPHIHFEVMVSSVSRRTNPLEYIR